MKKNLGPCRSALRRRATRALAGAAMAVLFLGGVLWYGVHRVRWLGPALADGLRTVIGARAVSRLEDLSYSVEDRWNRMTRKGEKPQAHWEVPASPPPSPVAPSATRPVFRPADVGPVFANAAAQGDGAWVPVDIPEHPSDPPLLYKTLLHPDPRRAWAELFVVAIDMRRARLDAAPGTEEPKSELPEARTYARTGVIPESQRADLLLAFNGGFKAEHGHYGMGVNGVTLLAPRAEACTVAGYGGDALGIGTWKTMANTADDMRWWRQAPACLVENGRLHPGLANEASISWGAALGGDTVVRRSAIGLSADGAILYVGVSNATTARTLALGMQHLGAKDVAQLDINWSYPHVVMFRRSRSGGREALGLFDGFVFDKNDYLAHPATRDFFYVTAKPSPKS